MADPTQVINTTTTIPDYARPYVEQLLGMTGGAIYDYEYKDANGNIVPAGTPGAVSTGVPLGLKGYEKYPGERTATFTDLQKQAFTGAQNLGYNPYSIGAATGLQGAAQKAAQTSYAPSTFDYTSVNAPNLQNYQMRGPQDVQSQQFGQQAADQYMSPYMQSVVGIQQREAQRQADIAKTQRNAQAVGAGAFGGSRQAILDAEAARNLATQKGDIQAQGLQSAYAQAQQQYNADQAQRMQAALANQGMGYNVGSQNLQANLGVQQLGSGQNLQAQLANQAARQQTQQLGEQSKQFGAGLGLQGLQAAMQGYQNLGTVGQNLYGQNISNINTQAQLGGQQQQQVQNVLNQQQQDFITQQQHPFQQLSYMSNTLRGVPLSQGTQTVYQQPPSMLSQVAGAGLSLAGLGNLFGGKGNAKGGSIKEKKGKSAGLSALVLSKMG
jgi:hypothetical protein